jgi:putative salt-induced outer membrane protein YdiY
VGIIRPLLAATCLVIMVGASNVFADDAMPWSAPKPVGGPIITPEGRIANGMDKSPWTGGFEFGLNGTEGNTQVFKLRTAFEVKYDTPEDMFIITGWYSMAKLDNELSENKALFLARNELPIDTLFSWFSQVVVEYDEFRDFDFRVAMHSGLVINAIKSDETLLKFRVGAGASKEIGETQKEWVPEAQFGTDFDQKITKNVKLVSSVDYYPDISNFGQYRIRARAAFEILLDPDLNMCLNLGAIDRYDSRPANSKRNDLDYYATLMFRF